MLARLRSKLDRHNHDTELSTFARIHEEDEGISLIETLIVVILLGILAATLGPRFIQTVFDTQGATAATAAQSVERETRSLASFEVGENADVDQSDFVEEAFCVDVYQGFWNPTTSAGATFTNADNDGTCVTDESADPTVAANVIDIESPTAAPENENFRMVRGSGAITGLGDSDKLFLLQDVEAETWACILFGEDGATGTAAEVTSGAFANSPQVAGSPYLDLIDITVTDANSCWDTTAGELVPSV